MEETVRIGPLVEVFKALADPARLRILGALAEQRMSAKDLAERLGLSPPTISHHMAKLVRARLVSVTPKGQLRLYDLDQETLRGFAVTRDTEAGPDVTQAVERDDGTKILRNFFEGPRLTSIPTQRKKRVVVLQHLLERFEPNREYTEKQVNAHLKVAHDDVATLRRELVNYGFLTRDSGVYRVARRLPERGTTVAQEVQDDERDWLSRLIDGATRRARPPVPRDFEGHTPAPGS